jgi:hypothetical protein
VLENIGKIAGVIGVPIIHYSRLHV